MMVAKGLGGGFPVGACSPPRKSARSWAGRPWLDFGGNALAMGSATAVLDVMLARAFLANVDVRPGRCGRARSGGGTPSPDPAGVRGTGLILGLQCAVPNTELVERLRLHKLLYRAATMSCGLVPP